MKLYWKIGLGICIILIVVSAQYWVMREKGVQESPIETDTVLASTTIPTPAISDPSGGGYAVKPLPLPKETTPKAPDLETVITGIVPKSDYEKLILSNLTGAHDALINDPTSYDDWLTVGMTLKQLEKYKDARDAFLYVASLWPTQPVPHGNLGSLYHLYLKDFPKSETAYKKAIELDPTQPAWHRGLYELYRYSYKISTNAWEDALKNGITQTNSPDLMAVLAGRYADLKRFAEAVVTYDRAIAEAERQENIKLVDTLIGLRAEARAQMK